MGWVSRCHGTVVAIDTAPLIYFIEDKHPFVELLDPFFMDLEAGKLQAVTSTVTVVEVLVRPLSVGDEALAQQYNDILLSSPNIATLPVSYQLAQCAAELRAQFHLKTPDAIQLAVALESGAASFLTNDARIPAIPGLEIIRLSEM